MKLLFPPNINLTVGTAGIPRGLLPQIAELSRKNKIKTANVQSDALVKEIHLAS